MKTALFLLFVSIFSIAHATELECKIYEDGRVRLATVLTFEGGVQQMTFNVGQETWRNPNHARPLCESLRQKFTQYKGEQWTTPECRCFGEKWSTKVSVFMSVDGEELRLYPNNWPDYYGRNTDPSFEKLVETGVPQCWENCGP